MSSLKSLDIEDFWIRVFLNPKGDYISASVNRTYRDLNRTLRGIDSEQSEEKYSRLRKFMSEMCDKLLISDFKSQVAYDGGHKKQCDLLITLFNSTYTLKLTYGQAQKWINMSFKYLFALGELRINGIGKNYRFFHIPIDNLIQESFDNKVERLSCPWSKLNCYDEYMRYQVGIREAFPDRLPLDVEFLYFNKA